VPRRQAPETYTYFGMLFSVPDSHTFSRNRASRCESGRNALKSTGEFERFVGSAQPGEVGPIPSKRDDRIPMFTWHDNLG
jgi:hypothetical protein